MTTIRLYGTAVDSIVDGPGLRYAVFTQGCTHACQGCHNPESHSLQGGYEQPIDTLLHAITSNKLIEGVTLSGGEPLLQAAECLTLTRALKQAGYNVWLYSGYLYEDIAQGAVGKAAQDLLTTCDVLVDGPFVESLHNFELKWRGSSNQRVIDIKKSDTRGAPVIWESNEILVAPPPSW